MCAAPWVLTPLVTLFRIRQSRTLAEYSATPPVDAPLVSLVIPARNEARNIARCVRSALAADYPRLEVIAVNDHSTDDTGRILASIAAEDARLQVVVPAPLPAGWFGKQWACTAGFRASAGSIVGFLDADTQQAPDLVPRIVSAMIARDADLLTVGGDQELGSFWEKLLQPQVFSVMAIRYGSTEAVNDSPRASDKIANGQCLFVRRSAHVELGGHEAVRDKVAEDLALAQRYFLAGKKTVLVMGVDQLSTRMYTSLSEVVQGWGKNIYAGGRDTMPGGRVGRAVYPLALVLPGLMQVVPFLLAVLGAFGVLSGGVVIWSSIVVAVNLAWWLLFYSLLKLSPLYVLLYPVGAALFAYIAFYAIVRGARVRWKGRDYISA